jgi:quercetin 2,3-dioxygenase
VSNLDPVPLEAAGTASALASPVRDLLDGREVVLGGARGLAVTRTLPQRRLSTVGAWCFADHYGPVELSGDRAAGMRVPPHPHTGLQTVSWLVEGSILHRDSLGNTQLVRPGELALMTAGTGIAHSEESPPPNARPPTLHGVQLWVALPEAHRRAAPAFDHHPDLPTLADGALSATVLIGEVGGVVSPARAYSGLVGAELHLTGPGPARLPLAPDFEYAVLALTGAAEVEGERLEPGPLLYLGRGRHDLELRATVPVSASAAALASAGPGRLLLLGGEPYEGPIVMWWNFVGRGHDDIVAAREDWAAGRRFGEVRGYDGERLPAPELPTTPLKPRPRA